MQKKSTKILITYLAFGLAIFVLLLNLTNPLWWQDVRLSITHFYHTTNTTDNPLSSNSNSDLSPNTNHEKNTTKSRINPNQLLSGGPRKDEIASINNPQFESIDKTSFPDDALIIGLEINGDVRAYPYAIMNWHEIVNDTVGGTPVAVTYCPLCESNNVFVRELDGEVIKFGVSGKLYQSCLVMYDRKTNSLYSQVWGVGIVGEKTNHVLKRINAIRTTVGAWRTLHPDSLILTTETGYSRDYTTYPYGSYYTDNTILFPVRNQNSRTKNTKEITQVIFQHDDQNLIDQFTGQQISFTQNEVKNSVDAPTFIWQGKTGVAIWDDALKTIRFNDANGDEIPSTALFNFAYQAYFQTEQ